MTNHVDGPIYGADSLAVLTETSPYNRHVEQRKALKHLLGRHYRKLVIIAAQNTKKDFLACYLHDAGIYAIQRRLHLVPNRFWRIARGKEFIDLPTLPRQLLLFSEPPAPGGPDAGEHRSRWHFPTLPPIDPVTSLPRSHG